LPGGRTVLARELSGGRPLADAIRFWDVEGGRLLRSFPLEGGDNIPRWLALAPDGKTLALGGDRRDPVIRLWDTASGKRVGRFGGHAGAANVLAFSPDGKTLASGEPDTTVLLWDVARARLGQLWAE